MNGSTLLNGLRTFTRHAGVLIKPAAVLAAGYCGGSLGVQFGPRIVSAVVNRTTTGYLSGLLYKQALNATLGQYYYPAGQLAFSSAATACPSPEPMFRAVREHFHHKNYLNELRNSHFDPKQLMVEDVEEGYVKYSYEHPLDESTYSIVDEEEASSLPKLPMQPSGKCDYYDMDTYSELKADNSGNDETTV